MKVCKWCGEKTQRKIPFCNDNHKKQYDNFRLGFKMELRILKKITPKVADTPEYKRIRHILTSTN